jgi:hypothetical protein
MNFSDEAHTHHLARHPNMTSLIQNHPNKIIHVNENANKECVVQSVSETLALMCIL